MISRAVCVLASRHGRTIVTAALIALGWGTALAPSAARAEIREIDDSGQVIVLPQPAGRIISLSPHITELLYSAGAGDRIVGAIDQSDFPPAARQIPRIGDSFLLDLERIVSLRPDLIIVWLHGNSEQQLDRLRALHIPIFASAPRQLSGTSRALRQFGRLAGTATTAETAATAFDRDLAKLRARYAGRPVVTVFYQLWERPLLTINHQHVIDDVIRLCGGKNIFAGLSPLVPTVSPEAVVQADPEAIITAGSDPSIDRGLERWRKLPSLRATARGNLIALDPTTISRQSIRILEGARALCEGLDAVRARRKS